VLDEKVLLLRRAHRRQPGLMARTGGMRVTHYAIFLPSGRESACNDAVTTFNDQNYRQENARDELYSAYKLEKSKSTFTRLH